VVGADGKGRYTGDVALDVRDVAGAVVPVPGGIGPMTRAMLLTNVVERAEWLSSR
jgi:methylenetetrahydrofolate dehydrogenase (NADP+)/methenyltetrahydrofolate cyclohydrolase